MEFYLDLGGLRRHLGRLKPPQAQA